MDEPSKAVSFHGRGGSVIAIFFFQSYLVTIFSLCRHRHHENSFFLDSVIFSGAIMRIAIARKEQILYKSIFAIRRNKLTGLSGKFALMRNSTSNNLEKFAGISHKNYIFLVLLPKLIRNDKNNVFFKICQLV